jgi:hypothetical protein
MSANEKREGAPRTFLEFSEAKAALAEALRAAALSRGVGGVPPEMQSTSAKATSSKGTSAEPQSGIAASPTAGDSHVAWGLKSRREDKVKRLIYQLQVQRPSNEGSLPGGKSIPALPTTRDAWLPASRRKQDKL